MSPRAWPRWGRGHRLRFVLLVYVVLPLAATMGLGWFVAVGRFEATTERRLQEEIELIARALSVPLSRALDRGSLREVQQSLQATEGIHRVYGAYVYDATGDLVAALGTAPRRQQAHVSEIAAHGDSTGEYGQLGGRRVYSYFVPLAGVGGRITGVLQVTRRRREFDEHLGQLRGQAAIMLAGFTLLLAGLVLWGHHRALGRHVERLARDMGRVREGNLRHRATPDGFREISTLAESLNAMLGGIERSQRQLEEQRATQAALEARLREHEKLAALGGLAAGVAHELGTPLGVIQGRAQRLARDTALDDRSRRSLADIQGQVRRMEAIVRQLLDFGRGRSCEPCVVDATDVARRALASVADVAAGTCAIRADLPDVPVRLRADPAGLELALVNLIRNAAQAAPGGQVRVSVTADDRDVRFEVEDDGPGVPAEIRSRIWDPFFTTKPVGQGTGLGLALTQRAVTDMGGRVTLRSRARGGARFEIAVPREPATAAGERS